MDTPTFGQAAVAAPHDLAAKTGLTILAQGGNAIEAMVAMAATVAVVYPHMNSIGGDGFWLVSGPKGRVRYFEACGFAGSGAKIETFRKAGHDFIPPRGVHAAITVPGAIGGWKLALEFSRSVGGRLPLDIILADAIRHARDGVPVSRSQAEADLVEQDGLFAAPGFAATFLVDGKAPPAGAPLRQPALAACLDHLAHAGLNDFYRGDIGREMGQDLEAIGAMVTRDDLSRYEARVGEPLALTLPDATVFVTPPPTQGLSTGVTLGLFEKLGVKQSGTFEHAHGLIEAIKKATLVRNRVVTDPAHLTEDPARFLTDSFLTRNAAAIDKAKAASSPDLSADGDTIWMGAIDGNGLAVSMIQSVFWDYGSGVVLPKTGVLLQNRGMAFSLDPAAKNPLHPGRRPFHTLNPAMAHFTDGRLMPFGTMGGDAQPQILAQIFSRYRLGESLASAVDAPRFRLGRHWKNPDLVLDCESRLDDAVVRRLRSAGHPVVVSSHAYSDDFGHGGALVRHPDNNRIEAVHDPRSDGGALGL